LLPKGKEWDLVWNDEFDGDVLDESKWSFRLHLMHRRNEALTTEGVVLDGKSNLCLNLIEKDGQFSSPHLQTGENFMDRPPESQEKFHWPIAKLAQPKFMTKYGYFEIRCKFQQQPGWWSAFWLQSPIQGCCLDPGKAGIEVDIMENFTRDGEFYNTLHWNGVAEDWQKSTSGPLQVPPETLNEYHVFGVDWSQDGYVFYCDGKETWRFSDVVSHTEQFILVSTECMGYRNNPNPPANELLTAQLPDCFTIDYVRVFKSVK
jgi:beta-glucanase (GH16 family)